MLTNNKKNDTYVNERENFLVITAPNMSGKSTYIRQSALLLIQAFIGCFVPATYASFRSTDRLFTRIGSEDSLETNSSSFMVEMKEMSFILHNCTSSSFIIIDELGRSTGTSDAIGISWSICEYLASIKCYVLFTTHYTQLTKLASTYPNIKNCHMVVSWNDGQDNKMQFAFKIANGCCPIERYGIHAARMIGLPHSFTRRAQQVSDFLWEKEQKMQEQRDNAKASTQIASKISTPTNLKFKIQKPSFELK